MNALGPSQKEVQDGLDVMMLFLEYTIPFCSNIRRIRERKGKRVTCDIAFDQKHETIILKGRGKGVRVNIGSCATEDVIHFAGTLAKHALGTERPGPTVVSY